MKHSGGRLFHVLPRQVGLTLAAALRQWLPDQSWSQVRGLLKARRVMVSGNLCMDEGRRLKLQDVVKLLEHSLAPLPTQEAVRIRYLDEHLVVVEKPAGMTTLRHREERDWPERRKQIQPTLDELLPAVIAQREKRKGRKPPPLRPVHRLDRETSGLMVFARSVPAERVLGAQFREHSIHRRYLAVVLGAVEAQTFQSNLVRDRGDGRRGSTPKAGEGKHAVTHVRPLETLGPYTLVECRLETGRTHQIRIHLAESGHPLCGEKVYQQSRSGRSTPDQSGAPRIALHAAELGFVHPVTGKALSFEMPLPDDLRDFVDRLRRAAK